MKLCFFLFLIYFERVRDRGVDLKGEARDPRQERTLVKTANESEGFLPALAFLGRFILYQEIRKLFL